MTHHREHTYRKNSVNKASVKFSNYVTRKKSGPVLFSASVQESSFWMLQAVDLPFSAMWDDLYRAQL